MYYPDELVEEVRAANDIVDVISQYVKLTKKGSSYFGLCPFHSEKTGSFSVSREKQMYYCFGCGAGGNVITFLMEYENATFQEALKTLADRVGIRLPERAATKEEREAADLKSALLEVNKEAARYFYYQLKTKQGERALGYLKDRRLSDETITRFGLGYANIYSDDLYRYLKQKGYSDSLLSQSGLVRMDERGGHDKFWNRVMFPIMDVNSRVIGFGGRVMGDGTPKYLNSPETKIFDKSRNLYGLNAARSARKPYLLICEGYMDVISMHQAGFTNAVASLGTAFTIQHGILIKRYVNQVILTYDSDEAGTKAALRAIPILKEAGVSVKVLNMKPYKDPDEFIKAEGAEGFQRRIDEAENSFLFEIGVLRRGYDFKDPEQKTAFQNEAARKLLEFREEMERNNYIEAVAARYGMGYEQLKKLVIDQAGRYRPPEPKRQEEPAGAGRLREKDDGSKRAQRLLLTWLSGEPELFPKIHPYVSEEDFTDTLYQEVALMVFQQLEKGEINPGGILNHFINDEEQYKSVAAIFHTTLEDVSTREEREKAISDIVRRIKADSLEQAGRSINDLNALQRLLKQQADLKDLHISLE
ncbi:MAG: DNA primase [Lachnospiraceae bacterium]|nr:DNA primase [Lachnospiraceae bacterium]